MGEYDDMILPTGSKLSASADKFIKDNPNARIHLSDSETIQPRTIQNFQQKVDMKPKGLWYGIGDSWLEWVRMNMPEWERKYAHLITIVPSRILVIKNYKELLAFEAQFGAKLIPNSMTTYIDWVKVAKKYAGIEIVPYIYQARLTHMWYYGWGAASGCVWMASAIQSIELIK